MSDPNNPKLACEQCPKGKSSTCILRWYLILLLSLHFRLIIKQRGTRSWKLCETVLAWPYCLQTRPGATCPNRGPPVFATATVKGSLAIEGDPDDLDAIVASLAAALGVDPALLTLDESLQRRAAIEVSFSIVADPNDLADIEKGLNDPALAESMASVLAEQGISAQVTPKLVGVIASQKREGEEWELAEQGENAGKYILKSCYKGSLLVNATLDTQVCHDYLCEIR